MSEDRITNRDFSRHNKAFLLACEKASIPPTKRQASKFRRKHGLAFTKGLLHLEVNHGD